MYHHSDLRRFYYCPRLFWSVNREAPEAFRRYVRMDRPISDCLIDRLNIKNAFTATRGIDVSVVFNAMETHDWILKGRFEADGLRVKIPAIHKVAEGWDVYFTYMGNLPKADDVRFYANHCWVLQRLGIKINEIYIVHFNANYIRTGDLDVNACLSVSATFYRPNGKAHVEITRKVKERLHDLKPALDAMYEVDSWDDYPITLKECPYTVRCDHYEKCFYSQQPLLDNSVVFLSQSNRRQEMIEQGIERMSDIPLEMIEGARIQFAQIMADKLGGLFADRFALSHWIKQTLPGPVSFLDFEWDTYALPPYDGMRPFDVLPFQYSLHILENNTLKHLEFLGTQDCRQGFVETLLKDLPPHGTIYAYNAMGAEAIRLRELARQFPQYAKELEAIVDRMRDLAVPFIGGLVYDLKMRGNFSLKKIIQAINPDLSYSRLSIQHGMEAVYQYREMEDSEDEDDGQSKKELLEYCSMDTYAMVEVYRWLIGLTGQNYFQSDVKEVQ
jgi:hypothetical protein